MDSISIRSTIRDGNLGDGWADNAAAARALAELTEATWGTDLQRFAEDGYDVSIVVAVQTNTSGSGPNMIVDCDDVETERAVRSALTDSEVIWQRFCDNAPAELLASE